MKRFYTLIILALSYNSFAQVGINTTTPDISSSLDISSANSGLLIPRVNLLDIANGTTPINTPAMSLLVYNTNALIVNGTGLGYYFWNGSQWIKLQTSAEEKWTRNPLTGRMYPTTISDNIGIGTTSPFQKFDVQGGNARINNVFIGDVGFGSLWAGIANYNRATTNGYGFLQSLDGNYTFLNKENNGSGYIGFRIGNIDKVIISNAGNMGIGTTSPSQKLDIAGKIKITDGTEGADKVLVSDATGVGSWVTTNSIKSAVTGVFAGGGASFGNGTPIGGSSVMTYCNAYIDLPVGKWMVFGTYLLSGATILTSGQSAFIRTSLYTSDTVSGSNPYIVSGGLISGILAGPTEFGIANGQTIINNTSGGTIRFYLWANIKKYGMTPATFGMSGVGSSFWSENQLTAIPMN